METATIRAGLAIGTKIAEYFGLIETVSTQVDKLVHQALKSALDNLEYAKTALEQNQIHYLLEAKNNFIKAIVVEENESKVMALCGLSICQYFLCDDNNAERTMNRIKDVELTRAEKAKAIAMDVGRFIPIPTTTITWPILLALKEQHKLEVSSFLQYRELLLEAIKTQATTWILQMMAETSDIIDSK